MLQVSLYFNAVWVKFDAFAVTQTKQISVGPCGKYVLT